MHFMELKRVINGKLIYVYYQKEMFKSYVNSKKLVSETMF